MLAAMLRATCSRAHLGVLGADASLELRPVDEIDQRLAAEPSGHARGESAQRHRLFGADVEARSNGSWSGERPLEGLRDVVRVHVVQHAEPEVGQGEGFTGGRTRAAGPWTQIVPQCSSNGRVGRRASTSRCADAGVKHSMSTTASPASAATRSPNTPAAGPGRSRHGRWRR